MSVRNYNRSRYYTQSTSSILHDTRETLGKVQEELKLSEEQAKHWKSVAKWFAKHYATRNNITIDEALEEYYADMERSV
jgi:hypothetical protein